jgi:hypothetical protein
VDNALLTAGIACLIGAIVGGGLKAFGIELPAVQSRLRQAVLALAGSILIVLARPTVPSLPGAVPPWSRSGSSTPRLPAERPAAGREQSL